VRATRRGGEDQRLEPRGAALGVAAEDHVVGAADPGWTATGAPARPRGRCRAYSPGTHARKDEDGLLLEFHCNPTRTRSV
jgi:hypothetical protein